MDINQVIKRNFTEITPEYEQFVKEKGACRQCSIYDCYKRVVYGEGNAKNPTFMFIGECPGAEEVEQMRPFIGRAGQRLRQELRKYVKTFDRTNTLISNVLACRPQNNVFPRDSDGPYIIREGKRQGKTVKAREIINFCATNWLRREIEIVQPKVIITLGAKSLDYVRGDTGVGAHRGSWKFLDKYRAWSLATYHPSYVLRCQNDDNKFYIIEDFANDIKKVATTWVEIVHDDPRMSMPVEEWRREKALNVAAEKFQHVFAGSQDVI